MTKFHNPYHFVPISADPGLGRVSRDEAKWPEHLTHQRYVAATEVDQQPEDVFSGRIVCRARVVELLAVGGRQELNDKGIREVELFRLNGELALPGSSLRGMIASLVETASNSALRVLDDRDLSLSLGKGREKSKPGTVRQYFRAVSADLVPLRQGDDRTQLTIAEQMFGVVEEVAAANPAPGEPILTLASRVRFSNAVLSGQAETLESPEKTKILASPKFRYPPFHFDVGPPSRHESKFIAKSELSARNHVPKGRKFYLHRKQVADRDWITSNQNVKADKQKTLVAPLRSGEFWFHVDFDNLAELELEVLCYALRPTPEFRHMLGMGKPLGLGKLEIEPVALALVDRLQRYRTLNGPRYARGWRLATLGSEQWPPAYAREAQGTADDKETLDPRGFAQRYRQRCKGCSPDLSRILDALELIGNPESQKAPVHYPQLPNGNLEADLYGWFAENDPRKGGGQYLRSLTEKGTAGFTELPTLNREKSRDPPAPSVRRPESRPTAVPRTASAKPKPDDGWRGPVSCVCTGRSNSKKFKFQVSVDGKDLAGVLWEKSAGLPGGEKFEAAKKYRMEYMDISPSNVRFRLPVKRDE